MFPTNRREPWHRLAGQSSTGPQPESLPAVALYKRTELEWQAGYTSDRPRTRFGTKRKQPRRSALNALKFDRTVETGCSSASSIPSSHAACARAPTTSASSDFHSPIYTSTNSPGKRFTSLGFSKLKMTGKTRTSTRSCLWSESSIFGDTKGCTLTKFSATLTFVPRIVICALTFEEGGRRGTRISSI